MLWEGLLFALVFSFHEHHRRDCAHPKIWYLLPKMKNEGKKLALKVIKTTTRTVIISRIIPAMFAQKKKRKNLFVCMQMWERALYVLAVVPHCTVVTPASFTGAAFEVAPWQCIYFFLLSTGRCQLYSWCAITLMSVSACRAHHADTWPWNESIITPGKCFCLFIFSHLRYSVLGCSQVAPTSYANALRGSLSLSLHLSRSFSPSLARAHM